MKTALLLFPIFFITVLAGTAQQKRNVFWLHGLGENRTTWAIYESMFENARQMDGYTDTYTSGDGFALACSSVISSSFSNPPASARSNMQNIAVGHSFGGVVARDIERRYTQNPQYTDLRFGGIITFGSPNTGGRLANNMANKSVDAALADACSRLIKGPQSGMIGLATTVVNGTISWNHDSMCRALQSRIMTPIYGPVNTTFEAYAQQGTPFEVREGSPEMVALNATTRAAQRISIYGNEQSPVHWRLASSFLTANLNDQLVPQIATKMRGIYNANHILNQSFAIMYGIMAAITPVGKGVFLGLTAHHDNRSKCWKEGVQWFDNSETVWNHLIGAQRIDTRSIVAQVMKTSCEDQIEQLYVKLEMQYNPQKKAQIQQQINALMNNPACYETTTVQIQVPINEGSDGLFHRTTQLGDVTNPANQYEALGVNHSEETNTTQKKDQNGNTDDVVRKTFELIWNRSSPDFFRVQ